MIENLLGRAKGIINLADGSSDPLSSQVFVSPDGDEVFIKSLDSDTGWVIKKGQRRVERASKSINWNPVNLQR